MYENKTASEKKNHSKAHKLSLIIHAAFVALLLFPLISTPEKELTHSHILMVDFSSGTNLEGGLKKDVPKVVKAAILPKKEIVKPKEETKPIDLMTQEEPVSEVVVVEEKSEEVITPKIEESPQEEVEKNENEEIPAKSTSSDKGRNDASTSDHDGLNDGENEEGESKSGTGRGFIEGTGELSRKIIYRSNPNHLVTEPGNIVLKICINRNGIVTYAEFDEDNSTINNKNLAREAVENVLKYKFENDRTAPVKECGRLTYILDPGK